MNHKVARVNGPKLPASEVLLSVVSKLPLQKSGASPLDAFLGFAAFVAVNPFRNAQRG